MKIDTGREIVLITNDLTAPATEIAALYKARWQVELFFKWLKQNLKIAHFLGSGRNAVTIQIMAALIAYLLLRIASLRNDATLSLQALARLMPATLPHPTKYPPLVAAATRSDTAKSSATGDRICLTGQQWVKPGHDNPVSDRRHAI